MTWILGNHCERRWRSERRSPTVADRIGNFYAGVILYFVGSVTKESITARLARAEIFDPAEIVAVHLIGKTVRSCYLMGVDAFLAPVSIDERKDSLGPHPSRNGRRSSDKGFLAMAEAEYLEILDWLARDRVTG